MANTAKNHRLGSRGRPEETRASILQAATREFAQEGVAGARTDAIARSARVNKALLYYYFKDKETLYGAVVDQIFSGLSERVRAALNSELPPREKYLAYVGAHFDYIASNPVLPRIAQREWMSAGRNASPHLRRIVQHYLRPIFVKVSEVIREGIAAGEFRRVDPMQFVPSTVAIVVSYFANAPLLAMMAPGDPLSPERIAARRAAVLDFVSAALFHNRDSAQEGAQP
jgi:TetR/AcrR family transcriptional regulator